MAARALRTQVWYTHIVVEQRVRIWALGVQGVLHSLVHALLLTSDGWLAAVTYQRCRVRDGRFGRLQLVLSEWVSTALLPLAMYLLLANLGPKLRECARRSATVEPTTVAWEACSHLCACTNVRVACMARLTHT